MNVHLHSLDGRDWAKAIGVGLGVSVITAALMAIGLKSGMLLLPKSLGLAFAETVLRRELPLPVGVVFHSAWVTAFSALYVLLFPDALTFMRALGLAIALWLLVLVFFFPLVGWGFLGLAISPKLIVGAAVPHLLFAVFLWGLCRWAFAEVDGRHCSPSAAIQFVWLRSVFLMATRSNEARLPFQQPCRAHSRDCGLVRC
jgi:hypothetical protein